MSWPLTKKLLKPGHLYLFDGMVLFYYIRTKTDDANSLLTKHYFYSVDDFEETFVFDDGLIYFEEAI